MQDVFLPDGITYTESNMTIVVRNTGTVYSDGNMVGGHFEIKCISNQSGVTISSMGYQIWNRNVEVVPRTPVSGSSVQYDTSTANKRGLYKIKVACTNSSNKTITHTFQDSNLLGQFKVYVRTCDTWSVPPGTITGTYKCETTGGGGVTATFQCRTNNIPNEAQAEAYCNDVYQTHATNVSCSASGGTCATYKYIY